MRLYPTFTYLLIFAIILIQAFRLQAQDDSTGIYKLRWGTELGLVAAGGAFGVGSLYFKDKMHPLTVDEVLMLDSDDINPIDASAIQRYNSESAQLSDVFLDASFGFPLLTMLAKGARKEGSKILVMYVESIGVNAAITEFTKNAVGRKRPYVYNENLTMEQRITGAAQRSFFSGHTSHVATMSYFTARVLSDYHPDSDIEWIWWTGAIAIPAYTGYLRYDGGRHFPTDIIVGYGVGALVGYFIPGLHETDHDHYKLTFSTGDMGNTLVGITWTF